MVRFTLEPLYPWGNRQRNSLDSRLVGPQYRSKCSKEKKFSPAGNRTPTVQPVAVPTEHQVNVAPNICTSGSERVTCISFCFCLSAVKARTTVGVQRSVLCPEPQPVLRNTCINRAADPRTVPPYCDVLFMVNYAETLPSYWCGRKRHRGAMRSFTSCK